MMRWGALLVGCVTAACGGGTGVDIDIIVPSDVKLDRVELWVAHTECYDCANGVAWTSSGERASGNIYFLHDEQVIKAMPQGDRWVLHLDAASGYGDSPWLAVVGMKGSEVAAVKVLRDVRIPASRVVTWQVYLHPAHEATTDLVTPPSDPTFDHRAHMWARQPTTELAEPTGCLAYQQWSGTSWDTEYFVPKTDPDCDGFPVEKECSEYWYQYKPLGSCVTHSQNVIPTACAIGVSPCADGVTSDKTCGPAQDRPITCLPDAFCNYCGDQIPADTCIAMAVEQGFAANALTHYDCKLDAQASGAPCNEQHAAIQLPWVSAQCGNPELHTLDRPFTEPQSSLTFGVAPNQVKFVPVLRGNAPCLVDLYWTGGTSETFKDGVTFLLEVPYDNSTHAVYPVTVSPSSTVATCSVNPIVNVCQPGGPTSDHVGLCAARIGP